MANPSALDLMSHSPVRRSPTCCSSVLKASLEAYLYAVSSKLLRVPLGLVVRPPPTPYLGGGSSLEHRFLRRLIELVKGRSVHQRDILREPGLGVVKIAHPVPHLYVVASRGRSHERANHTRWRVPAAARRPGS